MTPEETKPAEPEATPAQSARAYTVLASADGKSWVKFTSTHKDGAWVAGAREQAIKKARAEVPPDTDWRAPSVQWVAIANFEPVCFATKLVPREALMTPAEVAAQAKAAAKEVTDG